MMDIGQIRRLVGNALDEDIAWGDITTALTVPEHAKAVGAVLAKEAGVVAGLDVARTAFEMVDAAISFETKARDGERAAAGTDLALVSGPARGILTAERVALNFLQRLSGIATLTEAFVASVKGTRARIADTRKTTPGLRALEKYAVRVGGGHNHRFGLSDGILVKDNHIIAAGGISKAVTLAKQGAPHTLKVEVEVKSLEELDEALRAGADAVLLDNMPPEEMRRAVEFAAGRVILEASGGVNLQNVRQIAETGVDIISVGALTHSTPALDISLDFRTSGEHETPKGRKTRKGV